MTTKSDPDSKKLHIKNVQIVHGDRIIPGDICIENGTITYAGESRPVTEDYDVLEGNGKYAVPGFTDIHCHGGIGFDLTNGMYDAETNAFDPSLDAYEEHIAALMRQFARHGVTRVLLSTIAAPMDRLEKVLNATADYVESERNGRDGAELVGAFIEGTFVHREEFSGAQNAQYFEKPDPKIFDRLQAAARGHIRYINVTPDYGESALGLIQYINDKGTLVGAGHTSCPADHYKQAIHRGLKVAVHFTNGPTGTSFKPFGGGDVVEAVLTSPDVYAELIGDGYHVNPAYLMDIYHRKGPGRVIAVTDAMFVTDAEGVDEFEVQGIRGRISENKKYLQVVEKANTLFGSVLTMSTAFQNWLSWLTADMAGIWSECHSAVSLEEALPIVTRLCSGNPADVIEGKEPPAPHATAPSRELIAQGKRADIALLKLRGEPGAYRAEISRVFVKGNAVV